MNKNTIKELMFHTNLPADAKLFVDFNLLDSVDEFNGESAAQRFNDYMSFNITKYENGEKAVVVKSFANFSEESFFPKLGYGKTDAGVGKGTGVQSFIDVLEKLQQRDMLQSLTYGNIFAPVFVKDYGPDKSSDTLITLIMPELSEYTQKVATLYGYPTIVKSVNCWDTETHSWKATDVVLTNTSGSTSLKDYLLICPEGILTNNLGYNMKNFIFSYWRQILNAKLKEQGKHTLTVKELIKFIKANYQSNYAYMLAVLKEMNDDQLQKYIDNSSLRSLAKRNKRMNDLNSDE